MGCRLTYRCIEGTSVWEDGQSDEDINFGWQPPHVLDLISTAFRKKVRSALSADDDINQYARVHIHIQCLYPSECVPHMPPSLISLHTTSGHAISALIYFCVAI